MITINVRLLCALFFCLTCCLPASFSQTSANTYVKPYTEAFQYGSNLVSNRNGWNDTGLTSLVSKAGGHSIRPALPETLLDRYGYNIRLNEFKYYVNSLGMKEITCFIQQPSPAHADKTIFPGCTQPSKLFANLYEPIWNANGTVNANNYYANYVYKLLQTYGPYVKIWEVVNEPDLTIANVNPDNWLTRAPYPNESVNTQAPLFYYIRTLRITWEVVKKYSPNSYVATGGIGNSQYLDAILRYTDNPANGVVTAAYPNKGGAWFDVLSYHCYPGYYLRYWDNTIHGFKYTRNSDFAAAKVVDAKNTMQNVLGKYGYNGSTFPKKHIIITETNVSRRTRDWRYGSDTMQKNFVIKATVLAQKNYIRQLYLYTVGEQANAPAQSTPVYGNDEYNLMGLYENLFRDSIGTEKLTQAGKAFKSLSKVLYGYSYDSVRTKALLLPANAEGGAFVKSGQYVYVLWAKDTIDKSENFTANYSFPAALNIGSLSKYEWDYATTGAVIKKTSINIPLTASPSFLRPDTVVALKTQTITLVRTPDKIFTDAAFNLLATSSSALPVIFTRVAGTVNLNGSIVSITGTGTVIIEASQPGNTTFSAAKAVRDTFVISQAPQTISFPAITSKVFGVAPFALQAKTSSGLAVIYTVVSGPATVSGNTVTLTGTGTVTIRAAQPGNGNYLAANAILQSFSVTPSLTFLNSDKSPSLDDAPEKTGLHATPNPISRAGVIQFHVAETGKTLVNIKDLQGRVLGTLFNGTAQAGMMNTAAISTATLSSGTYIITLITATKTVNEKIIIVK